MCISWQWPAALYLVPTVLWLLVATTIASLETKRTYPERLSAATFRRRFARIVPYVVINTGMLPHQPSAFTEELFGALHGEFERTPKAASVNGSPRPEAKRRYTVEVHWPDVLAEAFFVAYQLAWTALFLADGLLLAAVGTTYVGACVAFLGYHAGRVCFVIDRARADADPPSLRIQAGVRRAVSRPPLEVGRLQPSVQHWLKTIGHARWSLPDDWLGADGGLERVHTTGFPRRPRIGIGDRLVYYAAGWRVVFAIVEATSEPHAVEHPRWPWRVAVEPLVLVPLLSNAPPVEAIGVAARSMSQQSHIRLGPDHYLRAIEAIASIAGGAELGAG